MKIKTFMAVATVAFVVAARDDLVELTRHIGLAELKELKDPLGLGFYLLTGIPREYVGRSAG